MDWLKLLVRKLRALTKLDSEERSWFFQVMIVLPMVVILLKTQGVKLTQKTLARLSPLREAKTESQRQFPITKISRIVELAVRQHPISSNCLQKSLVLWFLLRRQDIVSELRIGVRRNNGAFQAHAWIELGERVLNDCQTVRQHYAVFDRPIEVIKING